MNRSSLQELQARAQARLGAGERLVAGVALDLDRHKRFACGGLFLSERRLLAAEPVAGSAHDDTRVGEWREWSLAALSELRLDEYRGSGTLVLSGPAGVVAYWQLTSARLADARELVASFATLQRAHAAPEAPPEAGEEGDQPEPLSGLARITTAARGVAPLLRLGRFAKPRVGAIAVGLCLAVAATGASLVPPYLTMPLMDNVLVPYQAGEPVDSTLIVWYLSGLIGAAVLAWVLGWGRSHLMARVTERLGVDLRNAAYAHLQNLSLAYFGAKRTGDLISRISSDSDRVCEFLAVNLLDFITHVLMIVMTAVILLSIDPTLALATLAPFPLIAWLVQLVRLRLRQGFVQSFRSWGEMTSVLADTIPGIRVVKAFAQERRETERFRGSNRRVLHDNDRVNRIWAFFGPMVLLLTEAGTVVVWAVGAWLITRDTITVGVLTAFLAYITRFYGRLESMSRMVPATQRASASAQRLFEILDQEPGVPEPSEPVQPGRLDGAVEFRAVGFSFGARKILEGIDLAIRPGEMVGLVGHSGAGKSTMINLVCRFYDVADGAILVDGVDIRSYPVEAYRQNIGLVLQEPFLFYGTIAENIAYGRPDASRADIVAAARAAHVHELILRLPDGYDAFVGERGEALSGGERQRISIARALLIDPRVLILDEATSSVDTETERAIQQALENLVRGRTTIAIAHRLSTLRRADRLVVMEQGRIVESGRHAELIERAGVYARLHQAQREMAGAAV